MSGELERIAEVFGDRYAIERELGTGATARVYLARDRKHDRPVAIKVLRPELAVTLGKSRFLREIKLAARLSHPHILPLFDSGEEGGLLYYTTPYAPAESLRDRLERRGVLELDVALGIACEVADGLAYAHELGVVHRDIKPENILLKTGHAVIIDFGIGRAIDEAAEGELTGTGIVVGTPAYLSPEQASGERALDGRSDIYSLGCVVYEMLAGEGPFDADTPLAAIVRRFVEPVPRLADVRPELPESVSDTVERAMAPKPEDRFETATEFTRALLGSPGAPVGRAARSAELVRRTRGGRRPSPERSIAVLPFANMTGSADDEYFADGVTEEIINALDGLPTIRVTARTSSFAFKDTVQDVRWVGEQLGVGKVLEGSVRRAGDRIRITAQLVDVADGYHVWSDRYDREMKDIFAIQDDIAESIARSLKVRLLDEPSPAGPGTKNAEAYQLYLKARHFWYRRQLGGAVRHFEAAIAEDPGYAAAHAGLADSYCGLGLYGFVPSPQAREKALTAAKRAVDADPELAEAHYALGQTLFYLEWDLDGAVVALRRSIELNPRFAPPRAWLFTLLGLLRRGHEGEEEAVRAQELEPLSPLIYAVLSLGYCFRDEFDEAIECCKRALAIDPEFGVAQYLLSHPYSFQGKHEAAVPILERASEVMGRIPFILMLLGTGYWEAGRTDDARAVLQELEEREAREYVQPVHFAWIHMHAGELDPGFERLAAAIEQHDPAAVFLLSWPGLAGMRADPRYERALADAGLSEHLEAWTA